MNSIGVLAGLTTILSIWFGHVMVRNLEFKLPKIQPAVLLCILLGMMFLLGALLLENNTLSAISAIIGITFQWDALEFKRQQKRVIIGHAPANPKNSRHLRILAEKSTATTLDLLDREPRGKAYSQVEIIAILNEESKSEVNSE
ncbi:MAG: DUF4491 family protein [Anaerolineaceae bacterium]|nr:DUF4491 family protein [Anaerolineaceae bacterium]